MKSRISGVIFLEYLFLGHIYGLFKNQFLDGKVLGWSSIEVDGTVLRSDSFGMRQFWDRTVFYSQVMSFISGDILLRTKSSL